MTEIEKNSKVFPDVDLTAKSNWRELSNGRYAAERVRFLLVHSRGENSIYGPIQSVLHLAPGDRKEIVEKRIRVERNTAEFTSAIGGAISKRVCKRMSSKAAASFATNVPGMSAGIDASIAESLEQDFAVTLERKLSTKTAYDIEQRNESEYRIVLQGGDKDRRIQFRRRYWPNFLDIYLYSYEYIELKYSRNWIWLPARDTTKLVSTKVLGKPLVRLTFYEPQEELDTCEEDNVATLPKTSAILVAPIVGEMPPSRLPQLEPLEDLARLAFPVTRQERKAVASRLKAVARKKATKKKATKRKATRKKATKKKAIKRKVTKKRAVKKKAIKRSVTKKKAAKRKTGSSSRLRSSSSIGRNFSRKRRR